MEQALYGTRSYQLLDTDDSEPMLGTNRKGNFPKLPFQIQHTEEFLLDSIIGYLTIANYPFNLNNLIP